MYLLFIYVDTFPGFPWIIKHKPQLNNFENGKLCIKYKLGFFPPTMYLYFIININI